MWENWDFCINVGDLGQSVEGGDGRIYDFILKVE